MGPIRVVIAEDDVHQAEGIASMVRQLRSSWLVQNLVHDRDQLVQALEEVVPDVLLLDLHMPERASNTQSILQLVRSTVAPPIVILITGDPTKALEAYESDVVDYVVKPVRPARLAQALERAEEMFYARRAGRAGLVNAMQTTSQVPNSWLSGVRGRDIVLIDPVNIIYLQAERKYTVAFLSDGQALMRFGISDVEAKLDMSAFVRIHRSTIVNVKRIDFLRRDEMGRLRVHMKGRTESLIVSRTFEHAFKGV
ncbi:MAG: LytR/AlgR family response regulator transcription factor [Hydrogenophaga sp.]|uniref:LytR/AlgR family response regulator transcription factor n=1 Tax=Hydrogenophaga sp. TaxID=1904254 RepID=UPI0040368916